MMRTDTTTMVCCSASPGLVGKAIRGMTTLALRRMYLKKVGISGLAALLALVKAIFGKGPAVRIRAHVNHVFLLYKSSDFGQWFTVEIAEDGPTPTPAKRVFKKKRKVLEVFKTSLDIREGMRRSVGRVGRGYDFKGILGFFFAILKSLWTGDPPKNIFHSKGRDFCSEYVTKVLLNTDGFEYQLEPESTSPVDLSLLMKNDPDFLKMSVSELFTLGVPL